MLYSPARWDSLRSLFRLTFLSLHSLPPLPLLHMSLQAGLAALKTGACVPLAPSPIPSPTLSATSTSPNSSVPIMHNGLLVPSLPPTPSGPPPRGILLPRNGSHGFLGNDLMYHGPGANLAAAEAAVAGGGAAAACPICSSSLKVLAGEVPYSHHVNSTVVCRISGMVVEGDGGEGGQLVAMVGHQAGAEARVYSKEVSGAICSRPVRCVAADTYGIIIFLICRALHRCRVSTRMGSCWTLARARSLAGES